MKVLKRIVLVAIILAVMGVIAIVVYLSVGQYQPQEAAQQALQSSKAVKVSKPTAETTLYQGPDADPNNTYGFVFYQGAKVEADAYAPLLHALADRGWLCVAVDAPLDFAITNKDAATGLMAQYDQVEHWYIGGHSFGGFISSLYAADHGADLEGLILLGSRANTDLSQSGLNVISIRGSNDQVCNAETVEKDRPNLPANTHWLTIEGGNHAQFGDYGLQPTDGDATISPTEQVTQAVEFIDTEAKAA